MKILFIAGFGPITREIEKSRAFYVNTLGLPLDEDETGYLYSGAIEGAKHFAGWPLRQAALSCFGSQEWPSEIPAPTAWIEFDVDDLELATQELQTAGWEILVSTRVEPWGQTVTRFMSPEGVLTAVAHTPGLRS